MPEKLKAGIIGATGMVGQRFVTLLDNHPYFEPVRLIASPRSAGKTYEEALEGRWKLPLPMPEYARKMTVYNAADVDAAADGLDLVFCAVDMTKEEVRALEDAYAKREVAVFSNNSAHRHTPDVPMIIPEINACHLALIHAQRKRLGTKRGFVVVKPNCSIQSYVPHITPLLEFGIEKLVVTTFQAISGAGKTFADWPEMVDNVIPFISGEEEKSEREPLRIWGKLEGDRIVDRTDVPITAQCVRVPVTDGHLAAIYVSLCDKSVTPEKIIELWQNYKGRPQELELPHAPKQFITYYDDPSRPQTKLDRDLYGGMGVSAGRLRRDPTGVFDFKFIGLSHNTLRGAAGGAVLTAELAYREGWLD
ncbi:MAG TPA: aspartate-semialdehyde dehydrogenase [Bacillota bacterium]|nr:aspartate-semialdehyde dehydrogenase [Clostridiales bacterium]HPT84690.1 aspartate-semialdehyde dehydrogenase [Bacillota bacterium]